MAEQTQLSDNKISDALGLKMGLDPTGAMAVPKAPAAPKVSDESKNIIPQIDYTGLIKDVKTPSQALDMKAGLLGKQQQIDQNVLALEQQRTEKEAQLKLQNIEKSNEAIREEYEKMDKFYKDFPRPEFHPTKENMQDIATLFSLIGVVGTLLGGSGKASAMQSLSSMTGMMKGWREGRSDLWKKELQEFEKSTNAWKLKLEEARDGLKRALELQATNRQEADALAAVTVAKMGSPIVSEKVKKQGIQAGYTLLNEVQTALDKEIKQKFEDKKFNAEQAHRKRMEDFRQRELDRKEDGKGRIKEKEAIQIEGLDSLSDELRKLEKDFKPEYASLGILGFGSEQSIEAKRRLGTEEGAKAVQWWSRYERLQAPNRHALFGATLTGNELKNYQSYTAKKSDAPEIVRNMLLDQADYSQSTADQRRLALDKAGYKIPEVKPRPFLESYGGDTSVSAGDISTKAKESFGSYEPNKYEYRVNPETGKVQRKQKGQ